MRDPQEELKAYLDGELDPEAAAAVVARMEADRSLSAMADDFRTISSALGSATSPEPVGLDATLRALHRQSRRKPISLGLTWGISLAGVAASIFVFGHLRTGIETRERAVLVAASAPMAAAAAMEAPTTFKSEPAESLKATAEQSWPLEQVRLPILDFREFAESLRSAEMAGARVVYRASTPEEGLAVFTVEASKVKRLRGAIIPNGTASMGATVVDYAGLSRQVESKVSQLRAQGRDQWSGQSLPGPTSLGRGKDLRVLLVEYVVTKPSSR